MIKLLLLTSLLASCSHHNDCIEQWDMAHTEKVPVTYTFAAKCCEMDANETHCIAKIWKANNK